MIVELNGNAAEQLSLALQLSPQIRRAKVDLDISKPTGNAFHYRVPTIYFVRPFRAVPDYIVPDIVSCMAPKDEIRGRPLVFQTDFGITILELEFSRVESDALDGLENFVLHPLLQPERRRHNG
jgi:hypothetical protein